MGNPGYGWTSPLGSIASMGDHRDRPQGLCGFSHVGPPGSRGVVDVAQIETKEMGEAAKGRPGNRIRLFKYHHKRTI